MAKSLKSNFNFFTNKKRGVSNCQLLTFGRIMNFFFSQFSTFFQRYLETNDTSFESPKIEPLESVEKLGGQCPGAGYTHIIKKAPFLIE